MHDIHLRLDAAREEVRASAIAERFMAGESGARVDDEVNASGRRGRGGSQAVRCRFADRGAGSLHARCTRRVHARLLYVRPSGRGRGVGRMISEALIQTARARGYRTMLLDTVPSMEHAMALYVALGFQPVAPYRFNPVAGATFLKLDL